MLDSQLVFDAQYVHIIWAYSNCKIISFFTCSHYILFQGEKSLYFHCASVRSRIKTASTVFGYLKRKTNQPKLYYLVMSVNIIQLFNTDQTLNSARRILERRGMQTSSSFIKILLVCIPEFKSNF